MKQIPAYLYKYRISYQALRQVLLTHTSFWGQTACERWLQTLWQKQKHQIDERGQKVLPASDDHQIYFNHFSEIYPPTLTWWQQARIKSLLRQVAVEIEPEYWRAFQFKINADVYERLRNWIGLRTANSLTSTVYVHFERECRRQHFELGGDNPDNCYYFNHLSELIFESANFTYQQKMTEFLPPFVVPSSASVVDIPYITPKKGTENLVKIVPVRKVTARQLEQEARRGYSGRDVPVSSFDQKLAELIEKPPDYFEHVDADVTRQVLERPLILQRRPASVILPVFYFYFRLSPQQFEQIVWHPTLRYVSLLTAQQWLHELNKTNRDNVDQRAQKIVPKTPQYYFEDAEELVYPNLPVPVRRQMIARIKQHAHYLELAPEHSNRYKIWFETYDRISAMIYSYGKRELNQKFPPKLPAAQRAEYDNYTDNFEEHLREDCLTMRRGFAQMSEAGLDGCYYFDKIDEVINRYYPLTLKATMLKLLLPCIVAADLTDEAALPVLKRMPAWSDSAVPKFRLTTWHQVTAEENAGLSEQAIVPTAFDQFLNDESQWGFGDKVAAQASWNAGMKQLAQIKNQHYITKI